MSNHPTDVVSSDTSYRVDRSIALKKATIDVKREGQVAASGAHKPEPGRSGVEATEVYPENYVRPERKYDLVEEAGGRFRLIGLTGKPKIQLLNKASAPQTDADNRVRITNTSVYPHCVHGHCIITYPDHSQYIGSGTMVNRHHVITAGHVVFSKEHGGWATSIQFNAGQNDGTLPFGAAFATRLFAFKGWTDSQNRDFDTGMLILNKDLGNQTGWMGLITTGDGNLSNHQVTVEGYPGDKGGQQNWAATGPIVSVSSHQISYNDYTKGGDSGAGVYGTWQGFSGEHVCADHVAGPNGIPNTGSRLSKDKFDRIVAEWFPA